MKRRRKRRINKSTPRPMQFPFPKSLIGGGQYIRPASGDSMMPTIKPGDMLLIEPGNDWKDNSIVIAQVGNQETCKRLRIDGDKRFLVPDNPDYKGIRIGRETKIVGRVIARCKYESLIDNPNAPAKPTSSTT